MSRPGRRRVPALPAAVCLSLLLAACNRSSSSSSDGAPASSSSSSEDSPAPSGSPSSAPAAPDPSAAAAEGPSSPAVSRPEDVAAGFPPAPVEPRRASLRRLDQERALVAHEALLRDHFGGTLPSPIELQVAALAGERRAFLVAGEAQRRNPFLLVTSPKGDLLWTKERPLAGTRQVVTDMVITPGPRGEVALLWCDIPTQVVGLRKWGPEGTVLADFEVLEVDVCEALSALYWPGRGWVAVASQHGAARAQLLDEMGKRSWGPRGLELPWTARPSSPASIAVDTDASVMVFQAGTRRGTEGEGATGPERVLAMRYDTLGGSLWGQALDLGRAPGGAAPRVETARMEIGKVRVDLGARGAVTVTAQGGILGGK